MIQYSIKNFQLYVGVLSNSSQNTPVHFSHRQRNAGHLRLQHSSMRLSKPQKTSSHHSTLQHTIANLSKPNHTKAHCSRQQYYSTPQKTSAYLSIPQHTAAHYGIPQQTSATSVQPTEPRHISGQPTKHSSAHLSVHQHNHRSTYQQNTAQPNSMHLGATQSNQPSIPRYTETSSNPKLIRLTTSQQLNGNSSKNVHPQKWQGAQCSAQRTNATHSFKLQFQSSKVILQPSQCQSFHYLQFQIQGYSLHIIFVTVYSICVFVVSEVGNPGFLM